ncbi:MAG: ABC transporter permease, partial [Clostridia bacterium]|nr:ABC transporter permease [Clostridia bacterium]
AVVNGKANPSDGMMVYLMLENRVNIAGKLEKALSSVGDAIQGEPDTVVNAAYLTGNLKELLNPSTVFALLVSVAVIFGAGAMLIVGVYSAALTQDMKMQGLLWVLGTTEKQRKRAVWAEAGLLLLFSLPVGLLLGYLIGWRMLVPLLDSFGTDRVTGRFDGWVAIFAAVFTAATVLFSAVRPLKRIKKLTPVEAVRGEEKHGKDNSRWIRSRKTPGVGGLVWCEIARNPRAHVVPAVSVSLAVLLVALVSSATSVMRANIASDLRATDYQLHPTLGYTSIGIDSGVALTEEFCKAVENLDGAEKVRPIRLAVDHVPATEKQKALADTEIAYWRGTGWTKETFDRAFRELIAASRGTLTCCVLGVPRELFSAIPLKNENYPTADRIPEGDYVLAAGMYRDEAEGMFFRDGDTLTLAGRTFTVASSEGWSYYVTRRLSLHLYQYAWGSQLLILPLDVFEELYPDGTVCDLLVNEPEGGIGLLKDSLADLCGRWGEAAFVDTADSEDGTDGLKMEIASRFDNLDELRGQITALSAVGYSLSAILFLVGMLSVINAALASSAARRREYAMLEAVGMTGRQLGTMTLIENGFSVLVSVAVLAVSLPLLTRLLSAGFGADVKLDPVPAVLMLCAQLVLSLAVSWWVFRHHRKRSLSERIRDGNE